MEMALGMGMGWLEVDRLKRTMEMGKVLLLDYLDLLN